MGSSYNQALLFFITPMNKDWNDFLLSRQARIADQQVTGFGDPDAESQALTGNAIMADLSHLTLFKVEGADSVNFLQGQFTNDIKLLDRGHSQYTGYCTAKGRLLAIFLAFARQEHLYLQLNGALAETVTKRLRMYVLRSKVVISDVSNDTVRIGVAGAQSEAALQKLFGTVPAGPHEVLMLAQATLLRLPGPVPRFQIVAASADAPALWDALRQDCRPVGREGWEWLQIQAGIADITPATQEAFVPQMVNLDLLGGINFKKGCYTGQEIVARTHYLGKVKRRTHLAHVMTTQAPKPGDPVYGMDSSEPVGMVANAAASPQGGYDLLAEVRLESLEAGSLRLSGPEGPALVLGTLPYSL